jgi:hypothetical protein
MGRRVTDGNCGKLKADGVPLASPLSCASDRWREVKKYVRFAKFST